MLKKPDSIANDKYKSAKWDELVDGRNFDESHIPALTLLVQWYQVVDKCMEDIKDGESLRVAFENQYGDMKPMPQISTMKQASAEIRALNKQLGIKDEKKPEKKNITTLELIRGRRNANGSKKRVSNS